MSHVFVLDTNKQPLHPVHSGRARILLRRGKAAVFRRYPFTIILKEALPAPQVQGLQLKIDPGSKMAGLAIVNDLSGEVMWAAELSHRGEAIKKALDDRRRVRRSRRSRKTRYRKPRFSNRARPKNWLPPSRESRVANIAIAPLVTRNFIAIGRIILVDDITDRIQMEAQLTQSEKLSSIGLLVNFVVTYGFAIALVAGSS